ncbi:peroxisomal leader peptide-processing protease isoform X1 [Neodiprion virginianus]|uniref:peroxisomal leader peptide-processing protease isoform X1 n=1 Tax=Neodiprion fabricii TaxID=2872261 RepID=UPI001ED95115|nr:peroxisomal leader peptide-processing protease isoform X1 [Neodiprion fabricii]XP_046630226.1 peroxisomal leader peptide-processing protease isoform X1 [Neodiprion virginianus]
MEPTSVLISYIVHSREDTKNIFGSSGTLISENWVLAHGSLLEPWTLQSNQLRSIAKDLKAGVLTKSSDRKPFIEFSVSWEVKDTGTGSPPCCGAKVIPKMSRISLSDETCDRPVLTFRTKKARLAAVWKCPLLADAFEGILSSWRFCENVAVADNELFPLLLLLRIQNGDAASSNPIVELRDVLRNFVKVLALPQRGQEVEIESTPFGNPVFINSVSTGVVSNVLGPSKSLLLTDTNAVIGCEGGPIFIKYKSGHRAVSGIVIAPLSWCRGEWVGYTLGVSLIPCLHRILDISGTNIILRSPILGPSTVRMLDRSVVVVSCGSVWGSGVLVDKATGTFLTCSHVVKEAPNSRITISNVNFSARGELVYKTPNEKSYDLAIVRVEPQEVVSLQNVSMATTLIRKRDEVVCAGFPLFSTRDQPQILPTVTRGRVSHVSVGMLQTSCCIQSGASGGPVATWPGGELVGIVVCNATSAGNKALFPHVNMAVPATIFEGPIREYLRTQDVKCLSKLENNDIIIQQRWKLNPAPLAHL